MSYDIESFLADVKQVCLDNLNAKIASINVEKNDLITVHPVDPAAYALQQLNGQVMNYDPFLLYGVDEIATQSSGPFSSADLKVSVIVVLADTGEDIEIGPRMFRYGRALSEIFMDNWMNRYIPKIEVESLVPVPFTNLNSNASYRAVGVSIRGSLGR